MNDTMRCSLALLIALFLLTVPLCAQNREDAATPAEDIGIRLSNPGVLPDGTTRSADERTITVSGYVVNRATGGRIDFEARKTPGYLFGYIRNSSGETLIEYTESKRTPVYTGKDGTAAASLEAVPVLRVEGLKYDLFGQDVWREMEEIVDSPSGELIRHLGMYIGFHLPEDHLSDLRRALQVPFQALQSLYRTPVNGPRFDELLRIVETRAANTGVSAAGLHESMALIRWPRDCEMQDCEIVSTSDYVYSMDGGFVSRSLSVQLQLTHGYEEGGPLDDGDAIAPPKNSKGLPRLNAWMDDEADDCLGRCGFGCGSWSCRDFDRSRGQPVGEPVCGSSTSWEERQYYTYTFKRTCTTSGRVTDGCICHDRCARNSHLSFFSPTCAIACAPFAGRNSQRKTWTAGPRQFTGRYYINTGETCWADTEAQ